ncbi:MAG: transcriptional regulator [Candidatus Saccharimonadales bacterium]
MIEQLFGSKTRVKLLQLFYNNPNRSFYVREITRKIDEQINSVRRELANLLSVGLISSDTNNNRLYYEVDQKYEFYEPLSIIFGGAVATKATVTTKDSKDETAVSKPVAESDDVKAIKALGNVEVALFTGQFTRDELSGIDFLIVGDVNQTKLGKYVEDLEVKEGKEIRYVYMPAQEYNYRHQVNDRFLMTVMNAKKQVMIDKNGSLDPVVDEKKTKKEK